MKKNFIIFMLICVTFAQAKEIYINNVGQVRIEKNNNDEEIEVKNASTTVPLEWGARGLEFNFRYTNISTDSKKDDIYPLYQKYTIQQKLNDNLYEALEKDDFSRKYIIKFGYDNISLDKKTNNNFNFMFGYLFDDNKRIGLNFNYIDSKYKYNTNPIKGDIYSGNIYYYAFNKEKDSDIFLSIYGGQAKSKNNKYLKEKNNFIGANLEYSHSFEQSLSALYNVLPKYYVKMDASRNAYKIDSLKKDNDSINAELGLDIKKSLIDTNLKLDVGLKFGYNYEFMNEKKYKTMNKKDPYESKAVGKVYIDLKISEAISVNASYDAKVSTVKSKSDSRISLGFTVRI